MSQFKGRVAWFNSAKGYGFLERDGAPDLFVHYSAIVAEGYKRLQEGDEVEFDVSNGEKRLQAERVSVKKSVHGSGPKLSPPRQES